MECYYTHQATCAVSDVGVSSPQPEPFGQTLQLDTYRPHHGNDAWGADPKSWSPSFC